jgi:2'-5' RNA ligase
VKLAAGAWARRIRSRVIVLPAVDEDAVYGQVWERFRQLRRPAAHRADWAAWASGGPVHVVLVAPVSCAGTREYVRGAQRRLKEVRGVELHPPEFLHITVQSLGFADWTGGGGSESVQQLIPVLSENLARVRAFDLVLGGLNAFESCVFLEVRPSAGLSRVRAAIRQALGPQMQRIDPYPEYLFHLTVGYFGANASTSEIVRAVEPLRHDRGGRMSVNSIDLVGLPTDQQLAYPPLAPIARFELCA